MRLRGPPLCVYGGPPYWAVLFFFGLFLSIYAKKRIFAGPDRPYETPESPRTELNEDFSFNSGFLAPKKPCRNRDFFPQSRY